MKQIEQIKAEIERLMKWKPKAIPSGMCQRDVLNIRRGVLLTLKDFINSLPAEQQSSSLDTFIQSLLETYPTNKNEVPKEALNDYHQGLICGARKTYNWILKSAIDAKIVNDETSGCVVDCEQGCLVLEPHRYPIGQKLKILIMEDEL